MYLLSGDNLSELQKLASAMEKRQEYKTKSTPTSLEYRAKTTTPSLQFSVLKPTPKIIEPKDSDNVKDETDDKPEPDVHTTEKIEVKEDIAVEKKPQPEEVVNCESGYHQERTSQSPERMLDSSTDSVPPSESSMESSQTCTSSLESSSHSPPLEESSLSSERVSHS